MTNDVMSEANSKVPVARNRKTGCKHASGV